MIRWRVSGTLKSWKKEFCTIVLRVLAAFRVFSVAVFWRSWLVEVR
jgi:hypothetical protein